MNSGGNASHDGRAATESNVRRSQKVQVAVQQIELLRGGSLVSTLVGAFGGSLRETRLTALLGYLIALVPDPFCVLFGFRGKARSVRLEHRHENDRSDIVVETTAGKGVVEAKIGSADPFEQSRKYGGRLTALFTDHIPAGAQQHLKHTR